MTVWMLYAILFATAAAVAGFAIERGARALALPTRFVWLGMLMMGIALPLMLPSLGKAKPVSNRVEFVERSASSVGPASALTLSPSVRERMLSVAVTLDRPLVLFWIALSAFCLGRFVTGVVSLRRKRSEWTAREIAGTECFVTPDIGPAVVTMPETRIVLPEWALSLDQDSLSTVVRHERQHQVARDGWLIVTGAIATALMPWNPAVWLMRNRLRLAIEMDCDARVLAEEPRVDRYGSLLLAIAQRPRFAAGLAATLTESTSDLERRIDAMTARPQKHPRVRAALFAAVGVVAIAIACAMPAPDLVAPKSDTSTAKLAAPPGAFFEFQVERPASARPSNMPPRYPDALRAAGIEGKVIGKFVVDTSGHADMSSFMVVESTHPEFADAVREALPSMRFYPALVGGRPVKQLIRMPFTFSLVGGAKTADTVSIGKPEQSRKPNVLYEVPVAAANPREGSAPPPKFLDSNSPPVYPAQLRAANIEGMVQAKFVVRENGRVDMRTFEVIRSDHRLFEAAVRTAAEAWRFEPAMVKGKPVSYLLQMPFMFSLSR